MIGTHLATKAWYQLKHYSRHLAYCRLKYRHVMAKILLLGHVGVALLAEYSLSFIYCEEVGRNGDK